MSHKYCLSSEELLLAKASLLAAKQFGFIEEDGFAAMEQRCRKRNQANEKKLEEKDIVYGVTTYSYAAYLQQELTGFKLDFLSGKAENYVYRKITEEAKRDFYLKNQDLFTDFDYKNFEYDEVREVVEKRIREEEYYGYIKDILCQLREGQ